MYGHSQIHVLHVWVYNIIQRRNRWMVILYKMIGPILSLHILTGTYLKSGNKTDSSWFLLLVAATKTHLSWSFLMVIFTVWPKVSIITLVYASLRNLCVPKRRDFHVSLKIVSLQSVDLCTIWLCHTVLSLILSEGVLSEAALSMKKGCTMALSKIKLIKGHNRWLVRSANRQHFGSSFKNARVQKNDS